MQGMIEAKVPKDIRKYKTRVIGKFTIRQFACIVAIILLDIILFNLLKDVIDLTKDIVLYGATIIDLPIVMFGFFEPLGMPMEKYIKDVILRSALAPRFRKAKKVIYKHPVKQYTEKELKKSAKKIKKASRLHSEMIAYK